MKMALQDKILQRKMKARNKKTAEVVKAQRQKKKSSVGKVLQNSLT